MSNKVLALVFGGFTLQLAGSLIFFIKFMPLLLPLFLIFPGRLLMILGCIDGAKEKGWHYGFGIFFGLFGIIGFFALRRIGDRPQVRGPIKEE